MLAVICLHFFQNLKMNMDTYLNTWPSFMLLKWFWLLTQFINLATFTGSLILKHVLKTATNRNIIWYHHGRNQDFRGTGQM